MSSSKKKFEKTETKLPGPYLKVKSESSLDVSTSVNVSAVEEPNDGNGDGIGNAGDNYNNLKPNMNSSVIPFSLIHTPISYFVSRNNLLRRINECFQQCSKKTRLNERIVVLHGFAGIGKSETARQYVEKYITNAYNKNPMIKNVAWIDSESEESLKGSFVSLAKILKLELPSAANRRDPLKIAEDIYEYFSDKLQHGLFIFDNCLQMKNSEKYFGISKYLPTQLGLKQLPLILITARKSDWNIPKENIIEVQELKQKDSIEFLKFKLKLNEKQLSSKAELNSVHKLASALHGYPLGLTLTAFNIDNENLSALSSEIDNYLLRINKPPQKGKWIKDPLSQGNSKKYRLILANVLEVLFQKIISNGEVGEEALQLLKVLAYMPPHNVEMTNLEEAYQYIFKKEVPKNCLQILSESSLISIREEEDDYNKRIRLHRLVQLYTRIKQQEENDDAIVIKYCIYLSQKRDLKHLQTIFVYLRDYWPENTFLIQFCILFCSGHVRMENKMLRDQLRILFEYFQINCKQHFMLEKKRMEDNQIKLMMGSLYYYQNYDNGFFGDDEKLQDPQVNKQEINDFVRPIFKSNFEYLLQSFTTTQMENRESSEVALNNYAAYSKACSSLIGTNIGGDVKVTGSIVNTIHNNTVLSENKVNPIVTSFCLIHTPTSNFTGRENLLNQIHIRLQETSSKTRFEERIVVIHGFGGIGKSEIARKYVENYIKDPIIQNVAWVDSENGSSLKASFVSLAKILKMEIPSEDDKINAEELAKEVYQHFSDHVQNGLFIFDHSLQMKTSDNYFGILKYLPKHYFKNLPLILITTRTSEWRIPKENIIKVAELDPEEALAFLRKKLSLTQKQLGNELISNSVCKLASVLQGYPLGLTLAASNIDNEEWKDMSKEIENYLKRMEMPTPTPTEKRKWMEDTLSDGDPNNYLLMMSNVWTTTFENIESKFSVGKEAIQLLKIMAYMPPDEIKMGTVKEIFLLIFNKETPDECFSILSKFSLISIHEENGENASTDFRIRIHRLVQHYTRNKQQEQKDDTIAIHYCMYLCQNKSKNSDLLHGFFVYLKKYWSANTFLIQFSILFCSDLVETGKDVFENRMKILFDYFKENNNEHFMLQKERMEENQVNLMSVCLFYFLNWNHGFFGDDEKLQDPQINTKEIMQFAIIPIFKSYFEYLLHPSADMKNQKGFKSSITGMTKFNFFSRLLHSSTDIPKQNQMNSEDVFKNLHPMCSQILNHACHEENKVVEPFAHLNEMVDLGQCGFGRKETAHELYKFLGHHLGMKIKSTSSVDIWGSGIFQIHKHVYPTIDRNSEVDLEKYWKSGGPIKYVESMVFHSPDIKSSLEKNALVLHDVCKIIEQYMQFRSSYDVESLECVYYLDNILKLVEKLGFPTDLILGGLFMKYFHSFIIKNFLQMKSYQQKDCLLTFVGFFSKNKILMDQGNCSWSIRCVAEQMEVFYKQQTEDSRSSNYFGLTESMFVRDFIQLHKKTKDKESKVALKVAAFLLGEEDTCEEETNEEQNVELQWKSLSCGGLKNESHAAVAVNGSIYSFGGIGDNYSKQDPIGTHVLDINSPLEWKILPIKTTDFIPSHRHAHTVVVSGNLIYLWGGWKSNNQLHVLNTETLEWEKCEVKGKVPANRYYHTATVVRNKMYIFGGWDTGTNKDSNEIKCLELSTLAWSSIYPKNNPPLPRWGHSAAVHGDRFILIFGGYEKRKGHCNSLVYFDVETNEWKFPKATGTIPETRRTNCAFNCDGFMYIFGGLGKYDCLNDLWRFDFENSEWKKEIPKGEIPDPRYATQSVVVQDQVFVFGGRKGDSESDICDDTFVLTIE